MWREQAMIEWSWWVTSYIAYEPGEQLIVRANGDDESDLIRWSLLLLAATMWSFAHLPSGFPIAALPIIAQFFLDRYTTTDQV